MHTYNVLYKRDTKGNKRIWLSEIAGNKYRFITGLIDGKKVTSSWKTANPKNIGKKNETTGAEQAVVEVESIFKRKQESGYFEDVNDIDNTDDIPFKPMLASKYNSNKPPNFPVYAQPKLDGL